MDLVSSTNNNPVGHYIFRPFHYSILPILGSNYLSTWLRLSLLSIGCLNVPVRNTFPLVENVKRDEGVFNGVKDLCIGSHLSRQIEAYIEVSAARSLMAHVTVRQGLEWGG